MFEHSPLADDVSHTFGTNDYVTDQVYDSFGVWRALNVPSSLRIYLRAKVKPVSFLSTMRTLPKAPLPTTLSSRKWLRLTIWMNTGQLGGLMWSKVVALANGTYLPKRFPPRCRRRERAAGGASKGEDLGFTDLRR